MNFVTFGMKKDMPFDGKAYPIVGENAPAGCTGSARRVDERTIDVTGKVKDKHIDTQRMEVSPDGKTLKFTITIANRDKPQVQVLEREERRVTLSL